MREIIARGVFGMTLLIVVVLSFLFASAHNPRVSDEPIRMVAMPTSMQEGPGGTSSVPAGTASPAPAGVAPEIISRGRAVYAEQNCSTCHAIAGVGNPRHPLDGEGAIWTVAELKDWITGTGAAADVLSPAILKRKQRYQSLPEADLTALIAFLSSLRTTK